MDRCNPRRSLQADQAFRQHLALCPHSQVVFRYVNFLLQFDRVGGARLITQTGVHLDPKHNTFKDLLQIIKRMQSP